MSYEFVIADSEYLNYGDLTMLDGATALSGVVWVKPTTTTNGQSVVSKYVSGNQTGFLIRMETSTPGLRWSCYLASAISEVLDMNAPGNTAIAGTWQCLAFKIDTVNDVGDFWVNGVKVVSGQDASALSAFPNNSAPVLIALRNLTSNFFDGLIAEVAFWNKALSDNEFIRLSSGQRITSISRSNLVFHAPLLTDTVEDIIPVTPTENGTPANNSSHPNMGDLIGKKYMAGGVVFGE